jgi:hypothetical protein
MSHLNAMKTKISDKEMLIRALMKLRGLKRTDIEVHDRAKRIVGYHSEDVFVGNVIVRKEKAGIPSDIGWELKDGFYEGHLDSFDYTQSAWGAKVRYDETWGQKLQETYNQEVIKQGLTDKGIAFTEKQVDGFPVLEFEMETPEEASGFSAKSF